MADNLTLSGEIIRNTHRAYRIITLDSKYIVGKCILLVIPCLIFLALTYSTFNYYMNVFAKFMLSFVCDTSYMDIIQVPFLHTYIYTIDMPVADPSYLSDIITLMVSICLLAIVSICKISKPIQMWLIFGLIIHSISQFYFLLTSSYYDYNISSFTEAYVKTEILIWSFWPILLSFSFASLSPKFMPQIICLTLCFCYGLLFNFWRYTLCIYILSQVSITFMPVMFFVFGPMLDFIHFVGIYSLCATRLVSFEEGKEVAA